MKKLIYTLLILAFAVSLNAQWVAYTNWPTTNTIGGISIPETNTNYVFVATYNQMNPFQTLLVKTSDRGVTWLPMNTFPPFFGFPSSIGFYSVDGGIAIGMNTIIATTNGGSLWGALFVTSDTVQFENYATSPSTPVFWAIGNKVVGANLVAPVVILNTNFPVGSFLRLNLPASFSGYQLTSVCAKGLSTCVISTNQHPPIFLKTTNAGNNWSAISVVNTDDREVFDMISNDNSDDIVAVGGNNQCHTVYKSTNFGTNWVQIFDVQGVTGPLRAVNSPFEILRQNMYAVGHGGNIYKTTNSGDNWFQQTTNFTFNAKYVSKAYPDGQFAVCGGDYNSINGNILTGGINITTNGGSVFIQNISTEIPATYSLSQNYPNPFNPSTVIRFQLSVAGNASLRVYDMMGREVQTLVNEKLQAGTYETTFDGSNLSSGTYFYKLTSGYFTQTKKLTLIK